MSFTESEIVTPLVNAQNQEGDEKFDDEQVLNIKVAALIHDVGECQHPTVCETTGCNVGDVAWDVKGEDDGTDEAVIRNYVYSELYGDVPGRILEAADDIIDNEQGSFTREAFNTAERLGYFLRGLKAGELILDHIDSGSRKVDLRIVQLSNMAVTVTMNHIDFLRERQDRFPYIKSVISETSDLLGRIEAEVPQTLEGQIK